MSYISDYKVGAITEEEYKFFARRENAKERDERERDNESEEEGKELEQ